MDDDSHLTRNLSAIAAMLAAAGGLVKWFWSVAHKISGNNVKITALSGRLEKTEAELRGKIDVLVERVTTLEEEVASLRADKHKIREHLARYELQIMQLKEWQDKREKR